MTSTDKWQSQREMDKENLPIAQVQRRFLRKSGDRLGKYSMADRTDTDRNNYDTEIVSISLSPKIVGQIKDMLRTYKSQGLIVNRSQLIRYCLCKTLGDNLDNPPDFNVFV